MSVYTEWLNAIKAASAESWLTPMQRQAYDRIVGRYATQPFVALVGPGGCGKSFIARLLMREHGYVLVSQLDDAKTGSGQVILDGDPYTRALRNTRARHDLGRVTVLQRNLPADTMPVIRLELEASDVRQAQANLTAAGIIRAFTRENAGTDLTAMLISEALAHGDVYVTR